MKTVTIWERGNEDSSKTGGNKNSYSMREEKGKMRLVTVWERGSENSYNMRERGSENSYRMIEKKWEWLQYERVKKSVVTVWKRENEDSCVRKGMRTATK